MAVHADSLDLAQSEQTVYRDNRTKDGAPGADAVETVIGFFNKVLQVHTVEGGDEGAGCDREGEDGEFEVEKHKGVAVRVENGFDTINN